MIIFVLKIGDVNEQLSGQVKQLALATPPLFVDVELDQTGDLGTFAMSGFVRAMLECWLPSESR